MTHTTTGTMDKSSLFFLYCIHASRAFNILIVVKRKRFEFVGIDCIQYWWWQFTKFIEFRSILDIDGSSIHYAYDCDSLRCITRRPSPQEGLSKVLDCIWAVGVSLLKHTQTSSILKLKSFRILLHYFNLSDKITLAKLNVTKKNRPPRSRPQSHPIRSIPSGVVDQEAVTKDVYAIDGQLKSGGYLDSLVVLVDQSEAALDEMIKVLKSEKWDIVCVGAGLRRGPRRSFLMFEQIVNLVFEHAPQAKICFNEAPESSLEAFQRWDKWTRPGATWS